MIMLDLADIKQIIPHRPPFLWLDRVVELGPEHLVAEKMIEKDLPLFAGHYPDHPIVPGVILCEAVFQAGAVFIGKRLAGEQDNDGRSIPVLTRIVKAAFKRQVGPGDLISLQVQLKEEVGSVWFMKGRVLVDDKVAVKVEFACTLTSSQGK